MPAVVFILVYVLSRILQQYVGTACLASGGQVVRPAAWLAYMFILSIAALVTGLFIAVYR